MLQSQPGYLCADLVEQHALAHQQQLCAFHAPADLLNHITGVEIRPGQVDGVRDNEEPLLFQRMDVLQHPLQHVKIHLVNESRVLQRGDKAPWREKAL